MATPKQSEPGLSLDRRQLLAIGSGSQHWQRPRCSSRRGLQFKSSGYRGKNPNVGDHSLECMCQDRSEN